ncbi:MAG: CRTAC1 family protein, partial [Chitinophagaceae bacterium]
MFFADLDQDGDLDLYVAGTGGNKFFRNNGDGTFTENGTAMGLDSKNGFLDMAFGDWDSDGDLDIIALNENGEIQLFNNNRHSNFSNISNSVGFKDLKYTGTALAFGDYNNDGKLDIFIAGDQDGKCLLLKNEGGKDFVIDEKASEQISNSLKGIRVYAVAFLDFDNDGHLDILVAGVNNDPSKSGIKLFHNDGVKGFNDVSYLLPDKALQAYQIRIADFNYDGDEDIFLSGPTGIHLLRNDGGNLNNYVQIHLTGLSYGNSRNNRLGIGAQVELKAGDLYQMKTVKGPLVEFGVGQRRKIDAIRIIWPNGVPETVLDPTRKEKVLEQELLKGSCPFLYTWNGRKYEFIIYMLWRSALVMPLA